VPYFAELFAAPHQLTRRRANPHRALRDQGESNKQIKNSVIWASGCIISSGQEFKMEILDKLPGQAPALCTGS